MERRALLRRVSALGAVALAGCGSTPTDGGDGGGSTPTGTDGDPSTSEPPTAITDASVQTTGGNCQSGENPDGSVTFAGDRRIDVSGRVTAPNPCHSVRVASATYDADGDRLAVALETVAGDEVCTACVGILSFEGRVRFDGGTPGTVAVTHDGTVLARVDRGRAATRSG